MAKTNESASRLVEANGGGEALEAQLTQVLQGIQTEGARLRRWAWITAGIWMGTFLTYVFAYSMAFHKPGTPVSHETGIGSYVIIILLVGLLLLAFVSTVVLFFRLLLHFVNQFGSGRREANLRLIMIEERLRRMDAGQPEK